jgi:hypothetical protein
MGRTLKEHKSYRPRFRLAHDNRLTLAMYTHATDGMQDYATAALEAVFS